MKSKLWGAVSVGVSLSVVACGDEGGGAQFEGEDRGSSQVADASSRPIALDAGSASADAKVTSSDAGHDKPTHTCATVTTGVVLQPVHLAFAFDVSGSMGNGDKPWYDRTLKWDPVVSATKAFFASPGAQGMSASLTFFPGATKPLICEETSYEKPDVAMTALPSNVFAAAIDVISPKLKSDWRSGTPTLAALQGTAAFVSRSRAAQPGRYAMVLVTDGYPQSCSTAANKIDSVIAEAKKQLGNDLRTYVIGVTNPPNLGAPDTLDDLHRIAAAGGTDKAVLIDTGNPSATVSAFSAAIETIRQATLSCTLPIPSESEAGRAFDKMSVVVHYDGSHGASTLVYDKACSGSNGWRYDNADDPKAIELCEQTCASVRQDPSGKLGVEFACEPVFAI